MLGTVGGKVTVAASGAWRFPGVDLRLDGEDLACCGVHARVGMTGCRGNGEGQTVTEARSFATCFRWCLDAGHW